jgi:uncharacterized GH25 family protein
MKFTFLAASMVMVSAPVAAHDFWIQPQQFQVASGAPLGFTFQVGHASFRQRWGNGLERIVLLDDIVAGKKTDHRSDVQVTGATDFVSRLAPAGLHVVAMQSTTALSELPAIRFNDYAKAEGLVPILAARQRDKAMQLPGRERYTRRAKAFIQVGPQGGTSQALATRPVGLKLEIVPDRNPYALGPSRKLPVHVLYRGALLANATVKLTDLDQDAKPIAVAITDRDGRAEFTVPSKGRTFLLNVIWSEEVKDDPKTDFDTTFSSLTFGYSR